MFMLSGEIGPEGAVVGKKGQVMQSVVFQSTEDCLLTVYAGSVKEKTVSEEVMDRLVGRSSYLMIIQKLHMAVQEFIEFRMQHALPITIFPSSKVRYTMEVE